MGKSSSLIQPSHVNGDVRKLNTAERIFVQELLADDLWRPEEAAKKAGYKTAHVAASKLMKRPEIQKILGYEQRRRLERIGLRADEVLSMLATALFFNPLTLFKPTKSGAWAVEDLDKIPDEIGRCISEIKTKTVETDQGTVTYFELKMMDKTKLLDLAMKHCGVAGADHLMVESHEGAPSNVLSQMLANLESSRQVVDADTINIRVSEQPSSQESTDETPNS